MAVYGKLKRKTPLKSNLSLSPTKHSMKDYDTDLSSSQQTLFSSTNSSIDAFQLNTDSTEPLLDMKNVGTTPAFEDTFVDEAPSSPVSKNEKVPKLKTLFQGFEALDDDDFPAPKKKKASLLSLKKKTTIFIKKAVTQLPEESSEFDTPFSDDEFSSEISSSLNQLNSCLSELQSKVKTQKEKAEDFLSHEIKVQSIQATNITKSRTYGGNRSFKLDSQTLSEDEDDMNDYEKTQIGNNDLKVCQPNNKCKSMEELRLSGELESIKFEYEMTLNNIKHELTSKKQNPSKLLLLKLDLFNKIKSDDNFDAYLHNSIIEKHNTQFYEIFSRLLKQSPDDIIINFQLITYFKVNTLDILQIESISTKDLTIQQYANLHVKSSGKLMKDIVNDWVKHSTNLSVFMVVLEMLLTVDITKFEDNTVILNLVNSSLKSIDDQVITLSLNLLRSNKITPNLNTIEILSDLLRSVSIDKLVYNLILEYSIMVICNTESAIQAETNKLMFKQSIFSKLLSIVETNNAIEFDNISVIKQNQCLYALGYLFSFTKSDDEVTDDSEIKQLNKLLNYSFLHRETKFSLLQTHCLGYLGCISHYFLNKFNLLTAELKQQIKSILEIYQKSEYKSDETVYKEIDRILHSF